MAEPAASFGDLTDPGLTVGAYLASWLAHARGRIRAKTYKGYEGLIRLYASPRPGLGAAERPASPHPATPVQRAAGPRAVRGHGPELALGADPGPGPGHSVGTGPHQSSRRSPASPAAAPGAGHDRHRPSGADHGCRPRHLLRAPGADNLDWTPCRSLVVPAGCRSSPHGRCRHRDGPRPPSRVCTPAAEAPFAGHRHPCRGGLHRAGDRGGNTRLPTDPGRRRDPIHHRRRGHHRHRHGPLRLRRCRRGRATRCFPARRAAARAVGAAEGIDSESSVTAGT
jgi:hypothetical protein